MKNIARISFFLLLFAQLASFAAPPPKPPPLTINSAAANAAVTELTISGAGLTSASPSNPTAVTLSGVGSLPIVTSSSTSIVVSLPPAATPGTYTLSVAYGTGNGEFDNLDVTIGAVGPAGPPGTPGTPGASAVVTFNKCTGVSTCPCASASAKAIAGGVDCTTPGSISKSIRIILGGTAQGWRGECAGSFTPDAVEVTCYE